MTTGGRNLGHQEGPDFSGEKWELFGSEGSNIARITDPG
jgi:hypothetical protein